MAAGASEDMNEGTVLYIDPNDPQAAALLQQAGLDIILGWNCKPSFYM
jgi:hypothetical protein